MLINKQKQRGFTLIEMLVAVVVLSIGLLGLAGLQAKNLQFNKSAAQRSQATFLAYDIIDRMRANKTLAEAGSYDITLGTGPSGAANCESSACSSSDIAIYDKNQWLCLLGMWDSTCGNLGLLLEGDGQIARNGNIVTVTIRWVDDRSVDNTDANDYEARFTQFTVSTIL